MQPAVAPRANVLLVDDVPTGLAALEARLEPLGLRPLKVSSGSEVLACLLAEQVDCVLVSVRPAGLDGFEIAQRIKGHARTRHVPCMLLLSAEHGRADVLRAYAQGAVDCLLEPVDPEVLRAKVAALVELHRQAQEARALQAALSALRADVSAALGSGGSMRAVLQRCAQALVDHLGAAFARVWLLDARTDVLELMASAGLYTHLDGAHARVPVGQLKIGLIAQERRPHLSNDLFLDNARISDKDWARREGMRAFAGYPLLVEERLVGVIALFARHALEEDTLEALAFIADTIAQGVERMRAEEARRAGEVLFRRIFESNLLGLILTDYEGHVLDANEAFLAMVGYRREDLEAGRVRWDALTPPRWHEENVRAIELLRTRGVVPPFEKAYLRRDGSAVPVLVGSTRVEEQHRNLTLVLDLTERKQAEDRLRLLAEASELLTSSLEIRTVLQRLAELSVPRLADWCAVDLLTEDGQVERLAVVHRDPEKAVLGFEIARRWPIDVRAHGGIAQVLRTGESLRLEEMPEALLVAMARSEEHLAFTRHLGFRSSMCVPLKARGRVLGALTLIHAESGRRYGAADMALPEELARRAALALDNAQLFREVQEAVRLRDEFLSVASHELKTPLTPLSLKLDVLARELAAEADLPRAPRWARYVESARGQVRRLADLVNDLLDVSRISTGRLQLHLEAVDLAAVVRDVVAQFEQQAAKFGCSLVLQVGQEPLVGRWDRLRVEQVVGNLLSNAIKYGAGHPVHLHLEADGGRARLAVRDEGIGIAPEHLGRIFEKFERAVSERHYGGLGLGLYVTRTIVEALGGTVAVESQPGQGACFRVELPLEGRTA